MFVCLFVCYFSVFNILVLMSRGLRFLLPFLLYFSVASLHLKFYVGVDFIDDLVFRRSQVLLHGNVHLITFDLPDLQKLSIFGSQ